MDSKTYTNRKWSYKQPLEQGCADCQEISINFIKVNPSCVPDCTQDWVGRVDPFNSLPIKAQPHVHSLVDFLVDYCMKWFPLFLFSFVQATEDAL